MSSFRKAVSSAVTDLSRSRPKSEANRHARRAIGRNFSFSQTVFFLAMVFLFMPLFVLILYSFNSSKSMQWTGLSFVWYEQLFFNSKNLWHAFYNGMLIAVTSSVTATVLGTFGAIGVNFYRFRMCKQFLFCR